MSDNQKKLKLASLIQVLVALVSLGLGIYLLAGSASATDAPAMPFHIVLDPVAWTVACGLFFVLAGVGSLVCAGLGIRGANRPRQLGAHVLVSLIAIVLGMIAGFVSTSEGNPIAPVVSTLVVVLGIAALVFDRAVEKEIEL